MFQTVSLFCFSFILEYATGLSYRQQTISAAALYTGSVAKQISICEADWNAGYGYVVSSREVGRMSVTIHEAREIPTKERGGAQHSQVRLMLLPTRKTKHRTKIRSADDNPKFEETFTFKVPPGQISPLITSTIQ